MAKKFFFTVLFLISLASTTWLVASDSSFSSAKHGPKLEICNAAAPDSFRVESGGSTFVTLAWSPAWVGAEHTLKVYKKNEDTSAWDLINTFYDVPGASVTVSSLQYAAEHRFIIATNCISGEPSELTSSIDHINLILDLMVAGRNPVNPVPVQGMCSMINYQNYNWVGFVIKVSNSFTPTSTLYEFKAEYDNNGNLYPVIKRVQEYGPIMALGKPQGWPAFAYPKKTAPQVVRIDGSTTFLVRHYYTETDFIPVGEVTVNLVEGFPNTIIFCPNPNWNLAYEFRPLTAQLANGFSAGGNLLGKTDFRIDLEVKVQSPFTDFIQIFLPLGLSMEEPMVINIMSLDGQILFQQKVNSLSEMILVPTHSLANGLYLIRIETKQGIQTHKAVKI